ASAADPPSNTNYTKRPGQRPHKQTVNNLRTGPLGFLCLPLAVICLFPFRAPHFVNMEYQYMKRHGMLDENGDPLPQFDLSEEEDS
ncbi:MAG: hypothetical protein E7E22_06345, partial [Actinomyces sp.]|nr:hypothetical protein [Actinomyces sp.]